MIVSSFTCESYEDLNRHIKGNSFYFEPKTKSFMFLIVAQFREKLQLLADYQFHILFDPEIFKGQRRNTLVEVHKFINEEIEDEFNQLELALNSNLQLLTFSKDNQ